MAELQRFSEYETTLGNTIVCTSTGFFRDLNKNGILLAQEVLPAYLQEHPEVSMPVITDIGCSKAMDTWSEATTLAANGIPAQITGIDVNPRVLIYAHEPYALSKQVLEHWAETGGWPAECVDYFEDAGRGCIRPIRELRERVSFHIQDIREEPLKPDSCNVVIMNNVLSYYPPAMQEQIIGNAAYGLKDGGIFTACDGDTVPPEIYAKHHLEPIGQPEVNNSHVFYRQT